ncbi:hypothetical protein Tco_0535543 [Tanacetum coccineum]
MLWTDGIVGNRRQILGDVFGGRLLWTVGKVVHVVGVDCWEGLGLKPGWCGGGDVFVLCGALGINRGECQSVLRLRILVFVMLTIGYGLTTVPTSLARCIKLLSSFSGTLAIRFGAVAGPLLAKYTLEILKKHGMEKGQSIGTSMATKPKLDADLSGEPVDQTDYRSEIGSLMYLTSSRPDIVQVVCTINMGLWYPKGSDFELTAFSDVDHAGCVDTHKSTSGGIQFLGDKLVSWMSKKQECTVMSSAEVEYVALSASFAQVMWMRTQLQDYGFNYNKIPLYCDSQSAIAISCNPV